MSARAAIAGAALALCAAAQGQSVWVEIEDQCESIRHAHAAMLRSGHSRGSAARAIARHGGMSPRDVELGLRVCGIAPHTPVVARRSSVRPPDGTPSVAEIEAESRKGAERLGLKWKRAAQRASFSASRSTCEDVLGVYSHYRGSAPGADAVHRRMAKESVDRTSVRKVKQRVDDCRAWRREVLLWESKR